MDKAAWLGLGNMGAPMARNLASKGFPVVAYNRSPRTGGLGDLSVTNTVQDAVENADVVFVMVSDGPAVRDVLFGEHGAVSYMQKGTLVVNMSTIGVDETKQLALELANRGLELMDAPVSGSVKPAEDATLVVLAGGSEAAFERMTPLFAAISKRAYHLGPVGSGAVMKLLVNAMLGMMVESASECMAVADKAGLGREKFLEVLADTGMWAPIFAGKQQMWLDDDYPAAFALKHMTKDLGLMASYGGQLSAGMPALFAAFSVFLSAQARGVAELDMSAVAKVVRDMVGAS